MSLSGFPFAASATLNCVSEGISNPGSWGSSIQDVLIAPQDFTTLPVGEPVSISRQFSYDFTCTITDSTPQFGIGSVAIAGSYAAPGFTDIFTTPELHSMGLGYRAWWYAHSNGSHPPNDDKPPQFLPSVTATTPPLYWFTPSPDALSGGLFNARAEGRVQFFKIGPIQDTDGVRIPANISVELLTLYVADSAAPVQITATNAFVWTSSTIVSKVRACTPTLLGPNPNFVNLGTVTPSGTPAPGTVLVEQPFTLTFNCPYMAFSRIGFRFNPVHGMQSQTLMNTKPGTGMAKGFAIRLQMDLSGPQETINYNQNYYIPDFDRPGWIVESDAALTETRSRTINFTAELVRVNGDYSPGRVESALIIVMRYK